MENLPPIEKVYEAWSAVADGRVQIVSPTECRVSSSDGARTYTVVYNPVTDTYSSNDNATYWKGYPGYPVLAVMMLRERLPYDPGYGEKWAHINWTELNNLHKRDYAAAVRQVERERGIDETEATQKAEVVMQTLRDLPIHIKRLNKPQV